MLLISRMSVRFRRWWRCIRLGRGFSKGFYKGYIRGAERVLEAQHNGFEASIKDGVLVLENEISIIYSG